MRRAWESWLVAACDPQTRLAPPRQQLSNAEFACALMAAKKHFVLGSALKSAAVWQQGDGEVIREFTQAHLVDAGRTLGLRMVGQQATQAFALAGIPCCVLKGEDFASRLYPSPAQRPYRDVDVLVPRDAYQEANRIVQSLGFTPIMPERKYAHEEYGQISYYAAGEEKWSFELHWNLINSPAQRKRTSLAWEDLDFEAAQSPQTPSRDGGPTHLTPTSLLILAAVHACVGHRFDSLQQLCDIRQICRGAAGDVDAAELADACRRLQCETAVAWSLDMLVRVFGCPAGRALRDRCRFSRQLVRPWSALGPRTVLRPHTTSSRLRRSLARVQLKYAA